MEIGGRVYMYPPIHEEIDDEWGTHVYRVVFRTGRSFVVQLGPGDPMPQEEAHEQVREMVRDQVRNGEFHARDFYPQDPNDDYMQQLRRFYIADFAADDRGLEEEQDAAHGHGCAGRVPASGEAISGLLQTTSVKREGECSVCLMDFETGNKLRVMPCLHCFHEQCIFTWLQLNHVCPLCRFPLPAEQKYQR